MIGTLVNNRYRVDAKLGEGGMGTVYRAQDTLLQRPVAIKTVTPGFFGDEGARRFLREAQSVARLNHPSIVSIYDAVEDGGTFSIVMELVEGQTLRDLLPVPVDRLVAISRQVLDALEYAHGQGIVHRDIKPENILITADGSAKLMDFGLARSEGRSRLTQTGMIVGTVAYLAPEQALGGQVDGRSDLYALGAVLYEAVSGHPPFESDDPISVITQHINVPPVAPHWHNPSVPQPLENIILKLLAKDPSRRYQTAREVIAAMASVRGSADAPVAGPVKLAGPELVERILHTPLVGREAELSRLKELVDQAISARGGVVLLTGPLGVGKTRLVEEVSTFAHLRGVTVVSGKAYESAPPYEAFAKALRELSRGVDADTLAARLGEYAPEVTGLIPELTRQLPRSVAQAAGSPEDRKNRLFTGVAQFLTAMAAENPVLLFLDDMHLSDIATVELLQHAARRAEAGRLLLIVAYRSEDVPTTPAGRLFNQVTHALGREGFCASIALRPLTADQVIDLIQQMANHAARPVRFGQRIFEVTEGNPYFMEEVIKSLFEQGTLYIKDGQWSTDFDDVRDYSLLEIPSSVHGAVEARLRNLDDQTRQVLTHAAVIGRQFSFDTLLALANIQESNLLDRIEEATRAQLVREVRGAGEDVYEFAQPMLRQVLYDAIPRRRRRLLHKQAGEVLEKLYGRKPDTYLEALALHFSEGEDLEKTLKYSRLAAQKAAAVFAYDDGVRYLRQAIAAAEELDRPADRLQLMEDLGDLLFAAGKPDQVVRAYEDAVQFWKGMPGAVNIDGVRLYRKLGEVGTRWAVYNPRAREHIAEGLRLLEDAPNHPERAKLIISQAFSRYWLLAPEAKPDYAAAEESAREGYRLAETLGSLKDMSAALDALAGIHSDQADFHKMLEATQRRLPIIEQLNDPLERVDFHFMLTRGYTSLGNYPEALKHVQLARDLASRSGILGYYANTTRFTAWVHLNWDRWNEAERWCRAWEETAAARDFAPSRRWIFAIRIQIAAFRGDLEIARRLHSEFENLPTGSEVFRWAPAYRRALAALAIGDQGKSREAVEEGLQGADTPFLNLEFATLALQFASQFQEWDYIERLGDEALHRARKSEARRHLAANARAVGIHRREHGRLDEAEALLVEARDLFQTMDCRWELGKTQHELALLRRAQGRADDATRLLQEALANFEAVQARPDADRTRALLT